MGTGWTRFADAEHQLAGASWRLPLLVGALFVAVGGLLGGSFAARRAARDRVWRTTEHLAALGARVAAEGAPDDRARALRRAGPLEGEPDVQLYFIDAQGLVAGRSGLAGRALPGAFEPRDGGAARHPNALLQGPQRVQALWDGPAGEALLTAAPVAGGGWVVAAAPWSGLQGIALPILAPPVFLLGLLGLVVVVLGRTLARARSAQDLVGAFRSARAADRDRLRRVTRNLPALLFERLTHPAGGGSFTWVSPNSTQIVETDATDLVVNASGFMDMLHPADLPSLREAMRQAEEPPHLLSWEGRLVLPSGRVRWFRVSSRRVEVGRSGARWCGYMVDITDQRLLEEQLKQRGRLATIGQLAAGVAHEINNPLSYVIGNTRFVLQSAREGAVDLPEDLVEALGDAVEGGERVARIVQDLRTLARGGEIGEEPGPVDLLEALRTAARQTELELRFRARLVWDLPEDPLPAVHGHPDRLVQVFLNLLKNAALAIPPGDPAGNEVRVGVEVRDVDVRVRVQDTGPGVPEHLRQRIFDPFFTTRDGTTGGAQGQGLGLSVCLSIVNRLGGALTLDSTRGPGACFSVRLLRARGEVGAAAAPSSLGPAVGRLRLLAVDDEAGIVRSLQRELAPHSVDGARSGHEALELLAAGRRYDAIICDVMMPGMSGVEVYERIARQDPDLARRFVFLTGGTVSEEIRRWLDRARVPLLEKPASGERLLAAVAPLVQEARRTA